MRIKSYRITSQLIFLFISMLGFAGLVMSGLIYPFFFCYACPGAVAACPIGILEHSSIAFGKNINTIVLALYLLGFLGLLGLIFGRISCGWMCPIGFLQDLLFKLRKVVGAKFSGANKFFGGLESALHSIGKLFYRAKVKPKYIKYIVLILIPITSYCFDILLFTNMCPVGALTGTLPTLFIDPSSWKPGDWFWIKMIVTGFFLIGILAISRVWCRVLCPLGALLAPTNKLSLISIKFDPHKCVHCSKCKDVCPMRIDLPAATRDPECIGCGMCIDACKKGALYYAVGK